MSYSREQFIALLVPLAVADCHSTGVPASLTIAQACLESNNGNSALAVRANNLFGIKGVGPAGSITLPTSEQRSDGTVYRVNAAFRAYASWGESVYDHSMLLVNGIPRDPDKYRGVLNTDGKTAAREVQAAGYATDVNYAGKLIAIMDQYDLYRYDPVKEGDEPMTAEEKAAFEALQAKVQEQAERIASLTLDNDSLTSWLTGVDGRLKTAESQASMEAPAWFVNEFGSTDLGGIIQHPSGSLDFWRTIAVVLRMAKAGKL